MIYLFMEMAESHNISDVLSSNYDDIITCRNSLHALAKDSEKRCFQNYEKWGFL